MLTRFLYTRVILLRPVLLLSTQNNLRPGNDVLGPWGAMTLDKEFAGYACNLCVKTTQELVENLSQNVDTPYRISPWHTVYCMYSYDHVVSPQQILILNSVLRSRHRSHRSTKVPSDRPCGKGRSIRSFLRPMHNYPSIPRAADPFSWSSRSHATDAAQSLEKYSVLE